MFVSTDFCHSSGNQLRTLSSINSFICTRQILTELVQKKDGLNHFGFPFRFTDDVIIVNLTTLSTASIPLNLKPRILQTKKSLLIHYLHVEINSDGGLKAKNQEKRDDWFSHCELSVQV